MPRIRKSEIELWEAMDLAELSEDELAKFAMEGKLKVRFVTAKVGTVYVDLESLEQLMEQQAMEGAES